MNRSKLSFLLAACCLLSFAVVAGAADMTPAAGSYCNKLCVIGYHCVPTPDGGKCVQGGAAEPSATTASADVAIDTNAGGFCNKLCIIGYHCVPTPDGGKCVKGN